MRSKRRFRSLLAHTTFHFHTGGKRGLEKLRASCKFVPKHGTNTRSPPLCSASLLKWWPTVPTVSLHLAPHPILILPLGSPVKTPFLEVCQEGNVFFLFILKIIFFCCQIHSDIDQGWKSVWYRIESLVNPSRFLFHLTATH